VACASINRKISYDSTTTTFHPPMRTLTEPNQENSGPVRRYPVQWTPDIMSLPRLHWLQGQAYDLVSTFFTAKKTARRCRCQHEKRERLTKSAVKSSLVRSSRCTSIWPCSITTSMASRPPSQTRLRMAFLTFLKQRWAKLRTQGVELDRRGESNQQLPVERLVRLHGKPRLRNSERPLLHPTNTRTRLLCRCHRSKQGPGPARQAA